MDVAPARRLRRRLAPRRNHRLQREPARGDLPRERRRDSKRPLLCTWPHEPRPLLACLDRLRMRHPERPVSGGRAGTAGRLRESLRGEQAPRGGRGRGLGPPVADRSPVDSAGRLAHPRGRVRQDGLRRAQDLSPLFSGAEGQVHGRADPRPERHPLSNAVAPRRPQELHLPGRRGPPAPRPHGIATGGRRRLPPDESPAHHGGGPACRRAAFARFSGASRSRRRP